MAKIIVNVDTEADAIEVLIDGVVQENVQCVNFYVYEDPMDGDTELSTNISLMNKNKETGITTVTYLMAKDSKEGKEALASGAKTHKGYKDFVEIGGSDKVKADISSYFSRS